MTNEAASGSRLRPDAIHRLELDVEWEPGHVCAYLVEADEPVLIDAGVPGEDGREDMARALDEVGYGFGDVEHVVITHPHLDHVGTVPALLEEGDPTVYAPEGIGPFYDVEGRLDDAERHARLAGVSGGMLDQALERWRDGLERNRDSLPPDRIDRTIAGGDRVTIGPLDLEALHTPGHQLHHLCFFTEGDDPLLFSGDALVSTFRARIYQVGFGDGMFGAVSAYYDSYDRLRDRTATRVYPGHGPEFDDYDAAIERGEESLDDLVADVAAALDDRDEATAIQIAMTRFDDPEMVQSALFDTIAALGYLEQQGRASSRVDDGARVFRPS